LIIPAIRDKSSYAAVAAHSKSGFGRTDYLFNRLFGGRLAHPITQLTKICLAESEAFTTECSGPAFGGDTRGQVYAEAL
jgi:hypothetical protein